LVVMSIIAILAALLLPALNNAKVSARSVQCRNNLRQIGLSATMYVDDHGAYPSSYWQKQRLGSYWADQLQPYTQQASTGDLNICPDIRMKRSGPVTVTISPVILSQGAGASPDLPDLTFTGPSMRDYDMNLRGAGAGGPGWGSGGLGCLYSQNGQDPNDWSVQDVRESDLKAPGQMLAFGDSVLIAMPLPPIYNGECLFAPEAYYQYHQSMSIGIPSRKDLPDLRRAQTRRHHGVFNVVFCDGHIESLKTNQLFGLTDSVMRLWNRDNQPHRERWAAYGR